MLLSCDHLTLNSQIPWSQKVRCWEPLSLYIIMAYVWGPQFCFFHLRFSKIAAGIPPSSGALWNEWRDLFKETFYSCEDFSLPTCISAPKIWLQYCSISRVFSIAVTVIWLMRDWKAGSWPLEEPGGLIKSHYWWRMAYWQCKDSCFLYCSVFSWMHLRILWQCLDLPLVFVFNIKEEHRLKWLPW